MEKVELSSTNSLQKIGAIIAALGVTGTIVATNVDCIPGQVRVLANEETSICFPDQESADIFSQSQDTIEVQYQVIKQMLLTDLLTNKVDENGNPYDISISNKAVFTEVIAAESQKQKTNLSGIKSKDELINKYIELLQ